MDVATPSNAFTVIPNNVRDRRAFDLLIQQHLFRHPE